MNMNPWERRQKLLEILCQRRQETTDIFAREFNVSRRAIHNDMLILSCSYLVESVQGKNVMRIKIIDIKINPEPINIDLNNTLIAGKDFCTFVNSFEAKDGFLCLFARCGDLVKVTGGDVGLGADSVAAHSVDERGARNRGRRSRG